MKHESLDPSQASSGDLKESFYLARLLTTSVGRRSESPLFQPPTQALPPVLSSSQDIVTSFIEQCKTIADRVQQGFAEALQLEDRDVFKRNHHGAHDRLRLIHYPPASTDAREESIRAGAHSDYGSVTLLFQKDVGGLQVQSEGRGWIDIAPQRGCIVVNVGDAMEFWTAGLFRSTQHRVVMPRSEEEAVSRYSMAYFSQPDEHSILQPLPLSPTLLKRTMDPRDLEARLKRKGVDVDTARRQYEEQGGKEEFGHLARITLTGGEPLSRLKATYK